MSLTERDPFLPEHRIAWRPPPIPQPCAPCTNVLAVVLGSPNVWFVSEARCICGLSFKSLKQMGSLHWIRSIEMFALIAQLFSVRVPKTNAFRCPPLLSVRSHPAAFPAPRLRGLLRGTGSSIDLPSPCAIVSALSLHYAQAFVRSFREDYVV